jgi:hypothetical protein
MLSDCLLQNGMMYNGILKYNFGKAVLTLTQKLMNLFFVTHFSLTNLCRAGALSTTDPLVQLKVTNFLTCITAQFG